MTGGCERPGITLHAHRSGTTTPGRLSASAGWLALLLAVALLARVGIYARVPTRLTPDGFSYLNLARQLRGVPVPRAWDELANLPRHNEAARTPGYPLFLNLVFLAGGYAPTPASLLAGFERQRRFERYHFDFLERSENIRAVQLVQHALGLAATGLAYAIVRRWTGRAGLAALAAALAVGLRPSWLYHYEPAVHTEILAATLVLCSIWLLTWAEARGGAGMAWAASLSAVSAAAILVRPALAFAAPLLLVGTRSVGRCRWRAVAAAGVVWLALVGGWVIRNGVREGYWGISSIGPHNLVSHVDFDPGVVTDALVAPLCAAACGKPYGGASILRSLVVEGGLSYVQASSRLGEQVRRLIVHRPAAYLASVGAAFVRFWYPQEVLLPWEGARTRPIARLSPAFWGAYVAGYVGATGLVVLGVAALPVPRATRLSVALAGVAALGIACVVGTPGDNVRSAFPFAPIVVMAGAVVASRGRDWLLTRAVRRPRRGD